MHLLCFFQVGKRCWAISQNVIVGGRDETSRDLDCDMTYIVLDAFFETNDPQPALSVKVHAGTSEGLYRSLGRFFYTPGHSNPSLFNDDVMFEILKGRGVADEDLPDYCIAGCQEPLIMGKASLNTTNTWLNLAKILELAMNDGLSLITGKKTGPSWRELGYTEGADAVYENLEKVFYDLLDKILPHMRDAGNSCTVLLGKEKTVPFTSALMDSFHTWRDMRDPQEQGARYNAALFTGFLWLRILYTLSAALFLTANGQQQTFVTHCKKTLKDMENCVTFSQVRINSATTARKLMQ